jgi:hypothetical protein
MRTYLLVTGILFALFAVMHFFIAYEHWRVPAVGVWSGLGPALVGLASAAFAAWALRLLRVTVRRGP